MWSDETSNRAQSFAKVSRAGKMSAFIYFDTVCADTPIAFAMSFCFIPLFLLPRAYAPVFLEDSFSPRRQIIAYEVIFILIIAYYAIIMNSETGDADSAAPFVRANTEQSF